MQVDVVSGRDLTAKHIADWAECRPAAAPFDSAFFSPELTQIVASVRDNVEVGVLRSGKRVVGFFPYQRKSRRVATPILGKLSEFHGVVVRPDASWNAAELLRGCRISSWQFDHLVASQPEFAPYTMGHSESPYMSLAEGFEAYEAGLRASGSSCIRQVLRKSRKIEREVGPLRFEYHTEAPEAMEALIAWKTAQHQRTRRIPILRIDWVKNLLERIRRAQGAGFRGTMSALYAADEIIAVHLALAGPRTLHIWFPAYSREYEKYSPGLILLVRLAQAAADEGITRIDFGKGPERYKQEFKTGDLGLGVGAVDHRPILGRVREGWYRTKSRMRASRYREQVEVLLRISYDLRERIAFR